MTNCLHAGLELNGTTYKNFSKNEQTREKMAKPVKDKKEKCKKHLRIGREKCIFAAFYGREKCIEIRLRN